MHWAGRKSFGKDINVFIYKFRFFRVKQKTWVNGIINDYGRDKSDWKVDNGKPEYGVDSISSTGSEVSGLN
eukprot:scaffold78141_cov30-Attheya_sp.AAC.1